ncbi:MAG: VCBS repeat-containing protein [Planctomycetaceae bacterium]|nr:VCBS repeat-containing protein [Planctomycetaceae bacterium]
MTFVSLQRLVVLFLSALFVGQVLNVACADDADTGPVNLAEYYGFSGLELFKLDSRGFNLVAGDFDSDGRNDVVAVDNRSSCLRFFRQRSPEEIQGERERSQTTGGSSARNKTVNELKSDHRFDVRQISVDKQVAGLVADDFNGDGRTDLAFVGVPDRLVVYYQPEPGSTDWSEKWTVRLPELAPAAWMISSGDLNGDGRRDIAILGKDVTYLLYQSEDGQLSAPEKLINTSTQLALLQIADLDGDGRDDLSYQANEGSERGLCLRLQTDNGRLGPEIRFDLHQARSVTLADIDSKPGKEILTVDSQSGRIIISQLARDVQNSEQLPARLVQYGIGQASRGRAPGLGDIDGDGRTDVVVTDPDSAQILVYRQNGRTGLDTAEVFPGLLGAEDVSVADIDGDGRCEVILMSTRESAIAVSRFEDGRLTFPDAVSKPLDGYELAAIEFLPDKQRPRLAVCMKKGSGSSASVKLRLLDVKGDDGWPDSVEPLSLDSTTSGARGIELMAMDADRDGVQDLLVIPNGAGNKGVHLLLLGESGKDVKVQPLNLGTSSGGELFQHGGSLFVAREAFARKMTLEHGQWHVADQFNAGESKARISGVAVLNLDHEDDDEVVLIDTGIDKLRALKMTEGLFRPWKEVELDSLRFTSSHVADLNGDGQDDLLLLGNQQFAVLYSGRQDAQLQEIASFEIDREDAYPADIIAGDLNADGHPDLTVIDTSIDGMQILCYDSERGLKAVTHFSVFEEKRLVTESDDYGTEPREGMVLDVTSDGRADLLLLCHDRLILYPQDSADAAGTAQTFDSADGDSNETK